MKYAIIISFLFLLSIVNGQIDTSFLFVYAKSGLKLRNEPNLKSETIAVAAYGEAVKRIREIDTFHSRIEDRRGKWLKVNYQGQIGYMFSGFLSKLPRPKSIYTNLEGINVSEFYFVKLFFDFTLTKINKGKVEIVNDGEGDSQYVVGKEIFAMTKEYELIKYDSYETTEVEIIGKDWAFDDAKDIVSSIIVLTTSNDIEIKTGKEKISFKSIKSGFTEIITIKKIDDTKTAIHFFGAH